MDDIHDIVRTVESSLDYPATVLEIARATRMKSTQVERALRRLMLGGRIHAVEGAARTLYVRAGDKASIPQGMSAGMVRLLQIMPLDGPVTVYDLRKTDDLLSTPLRQAVSHQLVDMLPGGRGAAILTAAGRAVAERMAGGLRIAASDREDVLAAGGSHHVIMLALVHGPLPLGGFRQIGRDGMEGMRRDSLISPTDRPGYMGITEKGRRISGAIADIWGRDAALRDGAAYHARAVSSRMNLPDPGVRGQDFQEIAETLKAPVSAREIALLAGMRFQDVDYAMKTAVHLPFSTIRMAGMTLYGSVDMLDPELGVGKEALQLLLKLPGRWFRRTDVRGHVSTASLAQLTSAGALVKGGSDARGAYLVTDVGHWAASCLGAVGEEQDEDDVQNANATAIAVRATRRIAVQELILAMAEEAKDTGIGAYHVNLALGNAELPERPWVESNVIDLHKVHLLERIGRTGNKWFYAPTTTGREWIEQRSCTTSGAADLVHAASARGLLAWNSGIPTDMPRVTIRVRGEDRGARDHAGLPPVIGNATGTRAYNRSADR